MKASDRLEPFYQPIADLGSGIIFGFESTPHLSSLGKRSTCASWVFEHELIQPQTRFRLDNAMTQKAISHFSKRIDDSLIFVSVRPEWLNSRFSSIDAIILKATKRHALKNKRIVIQIPESSIDQPLVRYLCTRLAIAGVKTAITHCTLSTAKLASICALTPDFIKIEAPSAHATSSHATSSHACANIVGNIAAGNIAESAANVTMLTRRIRQLHNDTQCQVICTGIKKESDFFFAIDSGADCIQGDLIGKARREATSRFYALENITRLKKNRLSLKTQRLKASFKHDHQTTKHMQILLNAFHDDSLDTINARQIEQAGILRFFTCDRLGYQISPEFIFEDGRVKSRLHSMGWNWAHRPNFSMLHALNEIVNRQHAVSPPYYDDESKTYKKMHSFLFGEGDVALIEVHADVIEEREVV